MLNSAIPTKMAVPFANSGEKQTIPVASQIGISSGRASFTDGFPPLTRTPLTAGGIPPYGTDFNGILNAITSSIRWSNAGGAYSFDSDFSSSVGGYPKGALLSNSINSGYWFNTTDANTANPENTNASLTGWVPAFTYGTTDVTGLAATNVTLTALQAANERITLAGVLTANINLIFPAWSKSWTIVNNCTGAFSVTCKTPSGTGIAVAAGATVRIIGNGTNIISNESPLITGALQKSANLSDLANAQTALTNLGLTGIGIGLPTQLAIVNFDFQNFTFTSGANYLASTVNWLNAPSGVTYPSGLTVSITVNYIANSNNYICFTLKPHTVTNSNYRVYEVISVGAAGSRVFTVREAWNSANPVPITGGGTGAIDAAGGRTNLGLGTAAQRTVGAASSNIPDIAIADARYKPIDYTPVLSRVWVSNEYMPVTGTPTIVNHGLTGIDVLHCKADVLLKCIGADLAGYSPGDFAAGWGIHYNNAPLSPIPALSTSTITISSGNAGTGILVSGKGGGPSYAIDTTKWRFIFRIFY